MAPANSPIKPETNSPWETIAGLWLCWDRALAWTPLDWRLHFTRAVTEKRLGRFTEALRDFRQARFLEPDFAGLPNDEGRAWQEISPRFALDAFLEALRRTPPEGKRARFESIVGEEYGHPELRDALWHAARQAPAFELLYLREAVREDVTTRIAELRGRDPNLQTFDDPAQQQLFSLWMEKGDAANLLLLLRNRPDWMRNAWRAVAENDAHHGDFSGAADLCLNHVPPPLIPTAPSLPLPDARRRLELNPADLAAALAVYRDELARGELDRAAAALDGVTREKDAPAYVLYLEAELLARQKKAEPAWRAFSQYMNASR